MARNAQRGLWLLWVNSSELCLDHESGYFKDIVAVLGRLWKTGRVHATVAL